MNEYVADVIHEGLHFGEGPRWHLERLWYSDFYRHAILSVAADGSNERVEHTVEGQSSGLGWMPDGDLVYVSMLDHRVVRVHDGVEETIADISEYCGFWANDMVVSATGYAYVGNFGFDFDLLMRDHGVEGLLASPIPTTHLVVIDPLGNVIQAVADMAFPNGAVITTDGATLIVGESTALRLTAFTIGADGTLSERRVWAPLDVVAPDGNCLDANGEVWVANALANQCLRVSEGGEVTGVVTTSQNAYACVLGGSDRRTLYVMTAPTSSRFEVADATNGKIEAVRVSVPGVGLP